MVLGVVIDRSLLESPLANAPQIYGYTLLITEFGTEIVALALRHGFHRVIMLTDSAIELYEICLPHTYILCSFALFVYPFLLLIRIDNLDILPDSDYVYMCENNTIYGTKFHKRPNTKGKILIDDISSSFLSEPMDVSKYGMLFGGIQKNLGPAGLVIAIIRKDLISDTVLPWTPTMLRYKTHADKKSLYNTTPAYNIYIVGKVIKWIQALGGLEKMKEINEKKAAVLYDFLDRSKLFYGTVRKDSRSLMNVTFRTGSEEMDAAFIKAAEQHGMISIKGHRAVGGMRASIYNAMPMQGVLTLVDFMTAFEKSKISDCIL